jgi:hypothetical protein
MSRGSSSTTSPCLVLRRLLRLTRLVARLIADYFAYASRPGASACRAARHRLLCLTQLRRLLRLRRASGCLGTSCSSSRGSSSTTSPTSQGSSRGSSSTTSPTSCDQVPRLVARLVVDLRLRRASGCLGSSHGSSSIMRRLVARVSPVGRTSSRRAPDCFISRLDYSVRGRRGFVLRPHWLHFSHVVHRDYLSHGNTGFTSSTPRAATTSPSSRIASTTHLD